MNEAKQPPSGMPQLQSTAKTPVLAGMEEEHCSTEFSAQCMSHKYSIT